MHPARNPLFPRFMAAFLLAALPALPARPDSAALAEARAALSVLAERQRAAASVSVAYESRATGADGTLLPPVRGSLVTADSGRFRLAHAQGTVVSDGTTLWQHFPATGQVVIRHAGDAAGTGGVLLRFLQARAVSAERLARPAGLRVVLDPASVGEALDSLVLVLSSDGATVRSVETTDFAGNRVTYVIRALRHDGRPGREAFTFTIPADAEVVDMR